MRLLWQNYFQVSVGSQGDWDIPVQPKSINISKIQVGEREHQDKNQDSRDTEEEEKKQLLNRQPTMYATGKNQPMCQRN